MVLTKVGNEDDNAETHDENLEYKLMCLKDLVEKQMMI